VVKLIHPLQSEFIAPALKILQRYTKTYIKPTSIMLQDIAIRNKNLITLNTENILTVPVQRDALYILDLYKAISTVF